MLNVYKFGGASIASAKLIKNVCNIISSNDEELIVVVSALGKTTNEIENCLNSLMSGDKARAISEVNEIEQKYRPIIDELELDDDILNPLFDELIERMNSSDLNDGYDKIYDSIVSYGELFSTKIICEYLIKLGQNAVLLDARELIMTDDKHRDANVEVELSVRLFNSMLKSTANYKIRVIQGFIGATVAGETTTLGREGSDYSAAIVAQLTNSNSVTIWKDVDGILTADPRIYDNVKLVPKLNYNDAVELAYSGAQVIHPKTIRPLYNAGIKLFVKSFVNPQNMGSVICGEHTEIDSYFTILKKNQTLVTIKPKDFSFVLEDSFETIFNLISKYRQKVNMVQNSAVSISVVIDHSRNFDQFIDMLSQNFEVSYNCNLELVTFRGNFGDRQIDEIIELEKESRVVYLSQFNRRLIRLLRSQKM